LLIGREGCKINSARENLKKEYRDKFEIVFVEIKGSMTNYNR